MPKDSLGYAIARMDNEPVLNEDGKEIIRAGFSITFEYDGIDYGHAICVEADENGDINMDLQEGMRAALVNAYEAWMEENSV